MGLAYIVVAEIVAAESGVGYVILKASRFLDTPTVFVGILSIGLFGMCSDLCLNALSRSLARCFHICRGRLDDAEVRDDSHSGSPLQQVDVSQQLLLRVVVNGIRRGERL